MADIRSPFSNIAIRISGLVLLCAVPLGVVALQLAEDSGESYLAIGGAITFAVVASMLLGEGLAVSLDRFARFSERLAAGQLGTRVETAHLLPFTRLERALNDMARSLDDRMNALSTISSEQDTILRSMVEGVIMIDLHGRVRRLNKAASALLDVSELLSEGCRVEDVVRHGGLQEFVKRALETRGPLSSVVTVSGEEERTFEVYSSSLLTMEGQIIGTLIVLHDMTRIQKLESIRREFVANVSHELRTPITSIKGFVETLLDGAMHEPESLQKFLGIIGRHADRLNVIFSDLLTLARLEASEEAQLAVEPIKIHSVVKAAAELCATKAAEKEITLSIEVLEHEMVLGNASLMEQALVNLIENAVKYSEAKTQVKVSSEVNGEMVRILVADNGPGIDRVHLSRLFERFYRVDQGRSRDMGGTGLGLSIVKHIAQLHGGRVEVESVVGEGSTFILYFRRHT